MADRELIYTTTRGTAIYLTPGTKIQSEYDFKVTYQESGKRTRTPAHIHIIIDLYMKKVMKYDLTMQLVDHIIDNIILKVKPCQIFPPSLQIFSPRHVELFKPLEDYGEYPIEFLLIVIELIMIQEKTNYPQGTMNLNLFRRFKDEADIFSVVSAATFRGRR